VPARRLVPGGDGAGLPAKGGDQAVKISKASAWVAASVVAMASQAMAQQAVEWKVSEGGNGHWYQFIPDVTINWTAASERSVAAGGHLATIAGQAENDFIFNYLNSVSGYVGDPRELRGPFVGAFQDLAAPDYSEPRGGWRWVTGEAWSPSNWDDFGKGEPNDTCGCAEPEDVVTIDNRLGVCVWNDSPAAGQYRSGYLIEWEADCNGDGSVDQGQILGGELADTNGNGTPDCCEFGGPCAAPVEWRVSDGGNGHLYQLVRTPRGESVDWFQAAAAASAMGGHLATIHSAAENEFVFALTGDSSKWPNYVGPWIGGFQPEGSCEPACGWRWVNGEPWDWTNWIPGEPNDGCWTNEMAVAFNLRSSGWNDMGRFGACAWSWVWGYIVEWDSNGDCNGDGQADADQIARGDLVDTNHNLVPDSCEGGLVAQRFDSTQGWPTVAPPNDTLVRHITTGYGVVAGLDAANRVVAWGVPSAIMSGMPTEPVRSVSIGGGECAVAVRLDGSLAVWGTGLWPDSLLTRPVPAGTGFVAVSAAPGARHAVATRADGTTASWGVNSLGECDLPAGAYRSVSAGGHLFWSACTLGLRLDGSVMQAGGGGWFGGAPSGSDFRALSCGYYHGLALRIDGTVVAWGFNRDGQCNVPSGKFAAISAGSVVSVGIRPSGELVAWGSGSYAQISVPLGAVASEVAADAYGSAVVLAGDCNGNGVLDSAEVVSYGELDRNENGLADSCECESNPGLASCCRSDLDFDGEVGASDLSLVLLNLGISGGPVRGLDMDGNGVVEYGDAALLLLDFGDCPVGP